VKKKDLHRKEKRISRKKRGKFSTPGRNSNPISPCRGDEVPLEKVNKRRYRDAFLRPRKRCWGGGGWGGVGKICGAVHRDLGRVFSGLRIPRRDGQENKLHPQKRRSAGKRRLKVVLPQVSRYFQDTRKRAALWPDKLKVTIFGREVRKRFPR